MPKFEKKLFPWRKKSLYGKHNIFMVNLIRIYFYLAVLFLIFLLNLKTKGEISNED